MRVLCIDAKSSPASKHKCDLVEGEIYTVIKECLMRDIYGNFDFGYKLQERLHSPGAFYRFRFIPVSDIDETEMVRELQTVKQD